MPSVPGRGPWFRRHPRLAAAVTLVSFVGVTVLRVVVDDARDAAGLLYALPVALAATAYGRAIGTAASVSAAGLLGAWTLGHPEASTGAVSLATRALPVLVLGILLGSAADAAEAAADARTELAVAEAHRRDAAEVQDEILQRLTVARWRLEAGQGEEAAALLEEAMVQAQGLVGALLDGRDLDDRLRVRSPVR
jgi:signal transduction histidine kinase